MLIFEGEKWTGSLHRSENAASSEGEEDEAQKQKDEEEAAKEIPEAFRFLVVYFWYFQRCYFLTLP